MNDSRSADPMLATIHITEWLESKKELAMLRRDVEEICQQRATTPITRARLRHALAGVDWRKAK